MKSQIKDMMGKKYGRLEAIKFVEVYEGRGAYWLFKCDCGKEKVINGSVVRTGKVQSCGCYGLERRSQSGMKHGMSRTRTYDIWIGMKARCLDPNSNIYANYGAKGITVSKEWLLFENFYKDMGQCPEGLTLERIDNTKGYSKENCKWATRNEQNINKRYVNKTTGIRNISYSERDSLYTVGIARNKKRFRKSFKSLEDAIEWRDLTLSRIDV